MINLENRAIIEITGQDRRKFLQGLITNDINKATEKNLIYSAMLNAQGRFLYDFFIFEKDEKLMLDCFADRRDEIVTKLNFYKLHAQVGVKKNDEIKIFFTPHQEKFTPHQEKFTPHQEKFTPHPHPLPQGERELVFSDPRNPKLGHRLYTTDRSLPAVSCRREYDFSRISLKIPESELDLTYETSFILEFGFDDLSAVDYQKGCYIGQELTARTHHTGQIRKKNFHVKIPDAITVEKNSKITCEGKPVGIILSSVHHQNELHALALIKIPDTPDLGNLTLENHKIFIID